MIERVSTYAGVMQRSTLNMQMQAQLGQLSEESSSGLLADPARELGSRYAQLLQTQADATGATAVQTAATTVGNRLDAMQTALSSISSLVGTMSNVASAAGNAGTNSDDAMTTAAAQAGAAADQIMQLLNTTYGGAYAFSGNDGGTATMASSFTATSGPAGALATLVGSAVSANGGQPLDATAAANLVDGTDGIGSMFDDTNSNAANNYGGLFMKASPGTHTSVSIGGTQTLSYNMSGSGQAFRDILKGLSLLSLAGSSSSQITDSGKQVLVHDAMTALSQGQQELTVSTAELGAKQSELQNVADTQQAAASAAQQQIGTLDAADPYATATKLTALQTQLQASYEITASISKLSLVNYMG